MLQFSVEMTASPRASDLVRPVGALDLGLERGQRRHPFAELRLRELAEGQLRHLGFVQTA